MAGDLFSEEFKKKKRLKDALKKKRAFPKKIAKNIQSTSSEKTAKTPADKSILTVFEITGQIKAALERKFTNQRVKGEISKPSPSGHSGHIYFTLKDNDAVLNCVIWKNTARRLNYKLTDGDEVVIRGNVTVYPPSGRYQFIVEEIQPVGKGALFYKFAQLKEKFEAEGLFDENRKMPIPLIPRCIGVVSAETGAAFRDIIKVIHQRFPFVEILLAPSLVQGESAAPAIANALTMLDESKFADIIIVGRGGGSYEDLWAFNEEIVVRAIAACETPVIAAIGHQRDFTLADFVADVRAATPSHAGEVVVPVYANEKAYVDELKLRMLRINRNNIDAKTTELQNLTKRLFAQNPQRQINMKQQRVDELRGRMQMAIEQRMSASRKEEENLQLRLKTLSPYNVLERGYSITMNERGELVKNSSDVAQDETIITKLAQGKLKSRITDAES